MFDAEEKREILRILPDAATAHPQLGPISFATLLARADSQLAARAVMRNVVNHYELLWLERALRYGKPSGKRDDLCRVVERALEGRVGNVRKGKR